MDSKLLDVDKLETYATVLIGIVLGMAIARIVGFMGSVVVRSHYSKLTLTHTSWTFGLLLLIIQSWWAMFTDWNFNNANTLTEVSFLLVSPTLLYLASAVLCPDVGRSDDNFNLDNYHFKASTPFFMSIGLLFIVLIPEAVLMNKCGVELFEKENVMRLVAAVFFFAAPVLIRKWSAFEYAIPVVVVVLLFIQITWAGPLHELSSCQ